MGWHQDHGFAFQAKAMVKRLLKHQKLNTDLVMFSGWMMKCPLLLLLFLAAVAAQDFTEPNYQFNYGVRNTGGGGEGYGDGG